MRLLRGAHALRRLGLVGLALAALAEAAGASHGSGTPYVATLRSDYVKRLVDAHEPIVFVDLRKPGEYRAGHLPGALSLPITELDRRFAEVPRTGRVVLYCQCPMEDVATAYTFLRGQGYRNHAILEDGFDGWLRRGYPIVK